MSSTSDDGHRPVRRPKNEDMTRRPRTVKVAEGIVEDDRFYAYLIACPWDGLDRRLRAEAHAMARQYGYWLVTGREWEDYSEPSMALYVKSIVRWAHEDCKVINNVEWRFWRTLKDDPRLGGFAKGFAEGQAILKAKEEAKRSAVAQRVAKRPGRKRRRSQKPKKAATRTKRSRCMFFNKCKKMAIANDVVCKGHRDLIEREG